jgi:hypothetical protein
MVVAAREKLAFVPKAMTKEVLNNFTNAVLCGYYCIFDLATLRV